MDVRALLELLEREDDPMPALAYLAGTSVDVDPDELHAARRRALLLLAAGGDPRRELDPEGRAVRSIAADLESPARAASLADALRGLRAHSAGLARVDAALETLAAERALAWRWLACALLAEELGGDEE